MKLLPLLTFAGLLVGCGYRTPLDPGHRGPARRDGSPQGRFPQGRFQSFPRPAGTVPEFSPRDGSRVFQEGGPGTVPEFSSRDGSRVFQEGGGRTPAIAWNPGMAGGDGSQEGRFLVKPVAFQ
jgi:hypothetical protein